MKYKWTYFAGAVVLSVYFLLAAGAPPMAVAAGVAGAAVFMIRRSRTA